MEESSHIFFTVKNRVKALRTSTTNKRDKEKLRQLKLTKTSWSYFEGCSIIEAADLFYKTVTRLNVANPYK